MLGTTIKADPLLRRLETPLRGVFYPLGFRLEVESNDPRALAHAAALFGWMQLRDPAGPLPRLRVICDPRATAGPPWPAHSFRARGDLISMVSGPENFVMADLATFQGVAYCSSAMLDDGDYFQRVFLSYFTYTCLQRSVMTAFHAACVVRDGRGICLSGPPGAGKSSLTYACAKAGYSVLSDDATFLVYPPEAQRLRGNPARCQLRPAARALFPELRELTTIRAGGEDLLALPMRRLFPDGLAMEATLGRIVFLDRRADGGVSLEEVSPEETHRLLWDDHHVGDDEPTMQRHEEALWSVARDGAVRMRYSTFQQAIECLDKL